DYVPNIIGRTLITGKSHTIELVILSTEKHITLVTKTTLYHYLVSGALSITEKHGYSLKYDTKTYEDEELYKYFRRKIMDKSIDGIIIIPQYLKNYDFISLFKNSVFPYILLCPSFVNDGNINFVDMDNYHGGYLVAERFLKQGFKKIALINGPENHLDAIERERGFIDTLHKQHIHIQDGMIKYGNFTIASGYKLMKEILRIYQPEALFCGNDYMAAGAMRYLHETGLKVPADISVIGYDNQDLTEALIPPLTSVDNQFELLGEYLAIEILNLIKNPSNPVKKHIKPKLILRDSVLL
ncbi:MAG: LacI family DNA-binding transcriptional regulator, partial [Candidatus Kariarchaeaceae archaeon]